MSETKRQVLVVDRDRVGNLISEMLVGKYSTEVATDGLKAVNKLRELLPDAMVVEVDIPGSGFKLTELVGMSPKYNTVPIILTSAYQTPDMVTRAQNAGASAYISKPFGPGELQDRIDSVLSPSSGPPSLKVSVAGQTEPQDSQNDSGEETDREEAESETSAMIKRRVQKIGGLPSFPATHAEILKLSESEESSSEDIADKLKLDPGLLATVFKLVNSSHYGFAKKVDSLKLAVTLLGLEEIANLVMAAQVFEKMGNYEEGAGLDLQAFWKHAVGTAFVARTIAKKLRTETESAFLAGMLHDLGKVVLDRYFADYYASIFDLIKSEGMSIVRAEQEILGLSHAEIGGQLAFEWQFTDNYLNSILYHHNPQNARRYQRLVSLVHLADVFCRLLGYGSGGDDLVPKIDERVLERFAIGEKGMKILTEAAQADLEHADSFLSALGS